MRPATSHNGSQRPHGGGNDTARASAVHTTKTTGKKAYLRMSINGHCCFCLMDTGCEQSVLPARFVDKGEIKPTSQRILAANGSDIPVLGQVRVVADVGGQQLPVEGLVSEYVFEPMLGIDWMEANEALWIFRKGVMEIGGRTFKMSARPRGNTWIRRVMVAEETFVPPRSEYDVATGVLYRDPSAFWPSVKSQWATARQELRPGVYVAGTVVPERSTAAYVRVANLRDEEVKLSKGMVLAELNRTSSAWPRIIGVCYTCAYL